MSAGAASGRTWFESLRIALSPAPGRWQEATLVALATTTALAIAIVLQVPSFAAPNVALLALQRTTVCTWRNMMRRLLIGVTVGVLVVPLGGFLVQTPWLLVPAFSMAVAVLTYGVPSARNPVESILIAFPLVSVCFTGVYEPTRIAVDTRDLVAAELIGVVVATVFTQLSPRPSARQRLAGSLSAALLRSRDRLRETLRRYLDADAPRPAGEAPVVSDLASHVQLLDLARQEDVPVTTDRALVTMSTAAERIETFVGTVDTLSRQAVGRSYREAVAPQLTTLGEALARALDGFARGARQLGTDAAPSPDADGGAWPDLRALVAAVHARQLELRRSGELAAIDVTESGSVNAVVQSLAAVADVLHTPPWELRELAAEHLAAPRVWPWSVLPLDRFALRFALQVALGATIALVVGFASHVAELVTLLWNPLLVAQMSYGATIRKAGLRLAGVFVGGVLSILTIAVVFANTGDVTTWLAVMFLLIFATQYAVLGAPVNWYGPFQVAVTYIVVLVGPQPTIDVHAALWRALGTFAGTAILFAVFRMVAPDYAGRQLVARFADLLRTTLRYVPRPGVALPPFDALIAARLEAGRCSADILRLVDEARLEGSASGIDTAAAVDAAGVALRISLRSGIMARGRVTSARPPLAEPGRTLLEAVRGAVRERLEIDLQILEARHTMAAPGTSAHRGARRAARHAATRARPDLDGPFADLAAYLASARVGELAAWSPEALNTLLAELEHLRRVTELLPRLDTALERMALPAMLDDPGAYVTAPLPLAAVTRP